jgi:hypothetical protein
MQQAAFEIFVNSLNLRETLMGNVVPGAPSYNCEITTLLTYLFPIPERHQNLYIAN